MDENSDAKVDSYDNNDGDNGRDDGIKVQTIMFAAQKRKIKSVGVIYMMRIEE
jgi:hypothetical protein